MASSSALSVRRGERGDDDRGVRDDPARGDVAALRDLVAGLPQLLDHAEASGAHGPGAAPTYDATRRPAVSGRTRAGRRTPGAPTRPCRPPTSSACRASRSSTRTSTSSAAYSSQAAGSGRVDQSAAECSFFIRWPSTVSTSVARPTRGWPRRRPASSVSNKRGGRQPDLGQAGQVLGRGVQDPLRALQRLLERSQRGQPDRVDEPAAAALAADLDEVGAAGVPVARGALGVDRDRPGALGDRGRGLAQRDVGVGDGRQPVAQRQERQLGCLVGGVCCLGLVRRSVTSRGCVGSG